MAQSVTPPLHPSRDSRVAQATSAPRPPTAAAPPPFARRPPSPRHRTRPRPTSSDGAARGDPLARGDPRRPDPVPALPLLFSDRIHGGIRRLPLLPLPPRRAGESAPDLALAAVAARAAASPAPSAPGRRARSCGLLTCAGPRSCAGRRGRGVGPASPAPSGAGRADPGRGGGGRGPRGRVAAAVACRGPRGHYSASDGRARGGVLRAAPSSWRRRRGEPVLQSSNQQFG